MIICYLHCWECCPQLWWYIFDVSAVERSCHLQMTGIPNCTLYFIRLSWFGFSSPDEDRSIQRAKGSEYGISNIPSQIYRQIMIFWTELWMFIDLIQIYLCVSRILLLCQESKEEKTRWIATFEWWIALFNFSDIKHI